MLFDLLGYHRREAKPAWWAFFARGEKSPEQLRDEDREALGDLTQVRARRSEELNRSTCSRCGSPSRSTSSPRATGWSTTRPKRQRRFSSSTRPRARCVSNAATKAGLTPPLALIPGRPYSTDAQVDALFRFADRVAGAASSRAAPRCRHRPAAAPRAALRPGTPPLTDGPVDLDVLRRRSPASIAPRCSSRARPGPERPGPARGSRSTCCARASASASSATSHKAINNLLARDRRGADEEALRLPRLEEGVRRGREQLRERRASPPCANAPDR